MKLKNKIQDNSQKIYSIKNNLFFNYFFKFIFNL